MSSSSPSSLTCGRLATWITVAVLLQIIGLSLFVLGFFPVKPTLSGVSGPESYRAPTCNSIEDHIELLPDQRRSLYQEMSEIPPLFDRLILMVVDGLPAEFVLGKGDQPPTKSMIQAMPYTQSLLSSGTAIGYCAKAAPPTVTMPRLKAMVSGAIGGFLDVAFNFNTQAFLDDNLLGQLYDIGWKMVMLGDETWIKLFPTLFTRHDGVSSFYVKDTVEVDHNVSRHLGAELVTNDWNLLILHYLGLDHVGHIGGRNSILMIPKMKEMDEVIKTIHMSSVQHKDHPRTLLVIVSDHGMTDTGNHGGSSYEETDSLALFIGLGSKMPEYAHMTCNTAFQVDLAPTLALHFGVPIPKNNVGVLMAETFDSLTDGQKLRALQLNSWQLLRLLQAQLPDLLCDNFSCSDYDDAKSLGSSAIKGRIEEKFHCLFSKAASLHSSWTSQRGKNSRSNSSGNFGNTVTAYNEFLKIASEWLSRRATDVSTSPNGFLGDKPPELLAPGITILLVSCVTFLSILFRLSKEVYPSEMQCALDSNNCGYMWHLDETFVLLVIMILVFSMGSSSMVEEEQYIWHFLTSTLFFIFLRKSIQESPARAAPSLVKVAEGQNYNNYSCSCAINLVLICGRLLRGWHQGGVNWVHLPDISKWLEQSGPHTIKCIQIFSALLVISLSSFALHLLRLKRIFGLVVQVSLFISGLLVVMHIMEYEEHTFLPLGSTSIAQIVYGLLSMIVMVSLLQAPWTMPISVGETHVKSEPRLMTSLHIDVQTKSPLSGLRFSLYLIGWTYTICWCLLQLLLQQPINAMPILLLLLQFLASMFYFSVGGLHHKQWVEVAALYFLGMSGHFSLGNSNTLATIDVAGAFIGISSHSTIFSGIIMFIITFASPLLSLLSLVIYASTKDTSYLLVSQNEGFGHLQMMIGFPCVVPLALNSVTLTSFTVILLLMRNHLFVWSVFSPKYLYVFATTICVYIGVLIIATSGIYTCSVFLFRKRMLSSKGNGKRTKSR